MSRLNRDLYGLWQPEDQRKEEQARRDAVKRAKGLPAPPEKPAYRYPGDDVDANGRKIRVTEKPIEVFDKENAPRKRPARGEERRASLEDQDDVGNDPESLAAERELEEIDAIMRDFDEETMSEDLARAEHERLRREYAELLQGQRRIEKKIRGAILTADPVIRGLYLEAKRAGYQRYRRGWVSEDLSSVDEFETRLLNAQTNALRAGLPRTEKTHPDLYRQWVDAQARRMAFEETYFAGVRDSFKTKPPEKKPSLPSKKAA